MTGTRACRTSTAKPTKRMDPFTFMAGVVSLIIGVGLLWTAFVAPINPAVFKIAVPLGLVVFGALGLVLSRGR